MDESWRSHTLSHLPAEVAHVVDLGVAGPEHPDTLELPSNGHDGMQ